MKSTGGVPRDVAVKRGHDGASWETVSRSHPFIAEIRTRLVAQTAQSRESYTRIERAVGEPGLFRYPIISRAAQGSRMSDLDGNVYVDFSMGFGVMLLGHNPGVAREAMARVLRQRSYHTGSRKESLWRAAELFCKLTGHEKVYFQSTGTEAVHTAIRMARAFRNRPLLVRFANAYHGHSDSTLFMEKKKGAGVGASSSSRPGMRSLAVKGGTSLTIRETPGIPEGYEEYVLVLPYADW